MPLIIKSVYFFCTQGIMGDVFWPMSIDMKQHSLDLSPRVDWLKMPFYRSGPNILFTFTLPRVESIYTFRCPARLDLFCPQRATLTELSHSLKNASFKRDWFRHNFVFDKPEAKSRSRSNPKRGRGIWPLGLSLKSYGQPPTNPLPGPE